MSEVDIWKKRNDELIDGLHELAGEASVMGAIIMLHERRLKTIIRIANRTGLPRKKLDRIVAVAGKPIGLSRKRSKP